ncbi:MAG: ATP-binding protein [bacterium]|nr:ATP-binding protein [bacterium]
MAHDGQPNQDSTGIGRSFPWDHEIAAVAELLEGALSTLIDHSHDGRWPYAIHLDQTGSTAELDVVRSPSTVAMVGFSLAATSGRLDVSEQLADSGQFHRIAASASHVAAIAGAIDWLTRTLSQLEHPTVKANQGERITRIVEEVQHLIDAHAEEPEYRSVRKRLHDIHGDLTDLSPSPQGGGPVTRSSLFGADDPFTLYWALGLLRSIKGLGAAELDSELWGVAIANLDRAADAVIDRAASGIDRFALSDGSATGFVPHPWPQLRVVQLAVREGRSRQLNMDRIGSHFLDLLTRHLSWSELQDSSFDLAVLVFALEGVLLSAPATISSALLERAVDVVLADYPSNPALQCRQPFKVTETGGVHIPINVETATALLRVCRLVERDLGREDITTALLEPVARFRSWLDASAVTMSGTADTDTTYVGWQSDHEYLVQSKIEFWYTSQVALFLHNYGSTLARHRARDALDENSLRGSHVSSIKLTPEAWDPAASTLEGRFAIAGPTFRRLVDDQDRLDGAGLKSLLLYGPPGTGKTTFARLVASHLEWPLVILSPSHFIMDGEQRIESTAARLFDALHAQWNTVVLFDEIDRLILDRRTQSYRSQSDIFQFMTPSMLTKFQDLRDHNRLIFLISTNFGYKIDPAMIRPGRIDKQVLVLPPDLDRRKIIIADLLGSSAVTDFEVETLSSNTALYTFGELRAVVEAYRDRTDPDSPQEDRVARAVSRVVPAMRMEYYENDLDDARDSRLFLLETLGMAALLHEVDAPLSGVGQKLREHWTTSGVPIIEDLFGEGADDFTAWVRN